MSKIPAAEPATPSNDALKVGANSIVLEQNGEKKILKRIKLKGSPKFRLKPPEQSSVPAALTPPKRTFVCTFCQSRFDSHKKLTVHFLKHGTQAITGKNPDSLQAGKSGKRQLSEGSSSSSSSIMLIECEWCPETFTSMSKAIEHKYRKHNYEAKNYFCTLCGRLFPLKVALEQHQTLEHKGFKEVPKLDFGCGFCGTAFSTQDALELHVKTAHNLEKRMITHPFVPSPSKKVRLNQAGEIISIYYCHLCGSEYMLKFNLLKHIEDHHTYEDRCAIPQDLLKCSTCDSMFCTKKAFDAHNVHHKPEDLYVTSEEHRLNIVARVDQDFDFRRVPTAMDKALGTIGGSDSAAALAKKHRPRAKKRKNASATTVTGGGQTAAAVLDLGAMTAGGVLNPGLEALQMLLGE